MSKFAIDPGHGDVNGSLGGDGGAVGYLVEQNCALDIANKVISKLQALGHQAWNTRPSSASSVTDSLQKRCDSANNADYLVSIHLNAGGGKGTEVFAMSAAGNALASKVLRELVALGFINRGVKDGSGLYVIRHSNPVAILIEVCFVDTQTDSGLYNQLGIEAIANAIVKGLTGQTVQNSIKQEVKKVKNLVVYGEGPDKRAAEYLADSLKCPICNKDNLTSETITAVENIYMVGGTWKPTDKTILISGADRFETIKAVLKQAGRL